MLDQVVIKVLLIGAFLVFGLILLRPGGTARTQAIRTITLLLLLAAGVFAVLFPGVIDELARSVGVGRGTDLLLYAFIIVFVGNALSSTRKRRAQDIQITLLARQIALARPLHPEPTADD